LILKGQRSLLQELKILLQKGYTRVILDEETKFIEELLGSDLTDIDSSRIDVLIDRSQVSDQEDDKFRWADSVQTAFFEGDGICLIKSPEGNFEGSFSDRFERDGMTFHEPTINLFSFNNPYGACRTCEGFGKVLGIDENLVVPNRELSVYEGAIAPWRSETMKKWLKLSLLAAHHWVNRQE